MTRKDLISDFFLFLETKFQYAIIHHLDELFKSSKDIDFVVGCRHINELTAVIQEYINKTGNLEILNIYKIDLKIYRIDLLFFVDKKVELIELDACLLQRGVDILRINSIRLLKNRVSVDLDGITFFKLSPKDEYEYYVSKKAFKKDKVENHFNYLKSILKEKKDSEIRNDFDKFSKYYESSKFRIKKIKNKVLLLFSRLKTNPLLTIAFLGPDGSGKTTVIEKLIKSNFYRYTPYFHLKPIKSKDSRVVHNPHQLKEYSKSISFIKLIYFVLQYNLGWFKNILKYKIKSSLVVFDRYYYDILADPKRYRYSGSKIAINFFSHFIPTPDIIFILVTDSPKVIYSRKKEVEYNELVRQLDSYKQLNRIKNAHLIQVDKPINEVFSIISLVICKKMQERHRTKKFI